MTCRCCNPVQFLINGLFTKTTQWKKICVRCLNLQDPYIVLPKDRSAIKTGLLQRIVVLACKLRAICEPHVQTIDGELSCIRYSRRWQLGFLGICSNQKLCSPGNGEASSSYRKQDETSFFNHLYMGELPSSDMYDTVHVQSLKHINIE